MKVRRELKLGIFDSKTNTNGFIVVTHKKVVKEGTYKAMEDLRFLCRARNVDHMYAISTNVYEWQFIYYDRLHELQSKDHNDFFQLSPIYKLYVREKNYTYGDNELKAIIGVIRSLALHILEESKRYQAKAIVEGTCIDNTDELFWYYYY